MVDLFIGQLKFGIKRCITIHYQQNACKKWYLQPPRVIRELHTAIFSNTNALFQNGGYSRSLICPVCGLSASVSGEGASQPPSLSECMYARYALPLHAGFKQIFLRSLVRRSIVVSNRALLSVTRKRRVPSFLQCICTPGARPLHTVL